MLFRSVLAQLREDRRRADGRHEVDARPARADGVEEQRPDAVGARGGQPVERDRRQRRLRDRERRRLVMSAGDSLEIASIALRFPFLDRQIIPARRGVGSHVVESRSKVEVIVGVIGITVDQHGEASRRQRRVGRRIAESRQLVVDR